MIGEEGGDVSMTVCPLRERREKGVSIRKCDGRMSVE